MSAGALAFCCDERRAAELRAGSSGLTGIEFLEVGDLPGPGGEQRLLRVAFVLPPAAPLRARITPATVRVEGGDRVRGIAVRSVAWAGDELRVDVAARGDFSTYTLRLGTPDGAPLQGMDPVLSAVDFSFKADCPADGDCSPVRRCPPEEAEAVELDYLARDYASFRRLMLDRMALLLPGWRESSPADLGMALVELLAYVGDHLSYQQDAVAAEQYLETARRRVSVRRHARLLDYAMHDGRNARAWVHVRIDPPLAGAVLRLAAGTPLLTRVPGVPAVLEAGSAELARALAAEPEVFETMHDATLRAEHNALPLWAWGQRECCLPRGATRATLEGAWPRLAPGDVLVLEEVRGPRTGDPADADPAHRHAVRLTEVVPGTDPVLARAVTEVRWAAADALPFALCLSAVTEPAYGSRYVPDVSVARGNVVLADHGRTVRDEPLGAPPPADPRLAPAGGDGCGCGCEEATAAPAGRFGPRLEHGPVTQAARVPLPPGAAPGAPRWFDPAGPAAAALEGEVERALPVVRVRGGAGGPEWGPRRDLLASDAFARDLVVEVDDGGRAALRFGDDVLGERPAAGVPLWATYRVGNGSRGNVGPDALAHVVLPPAQAATEGTWVRAVSNLPARGGLDPEPAEHARQVAPAAFRALERAVTADDYARLAERHPEVQRAQARRRWTGSWRTVFLTVDRAGGREVDAPFEAELRRHLERYRMAGDDLEVDGPRFVPLEVELFVCVAAGYFRGDVERALREALGSRALPDGRRGLFHPDRFTFGQSVFLSHVYAAAQAVPGVRTVVVRRFRRRDQPRTDALRSGELAMGRLEVARLDDDPGRPEHGVLRLALEGGR